MKKKLLAGLLAAIAFTPAAVRAQYYTVQDLGTLTGTTNPYGYVYGMNNGGIVVGQDKTSGSTSYAFEYAAIANSNPGSNVEIGNTAGGMNALAYGINDSNTVVGWATTSGEAAKHAFSYNGAVMADLGTLGGTNSQALAINDSGTIVGFSNPASSSAFHAFSYSGSSFTDLGTAGGTNSAAEAISKSGFIVGDSDLSTGTTQAALFANGNVTNLGTLGTGYPYSQATGVNNGLTVVGVASNSASIPTSVHSFIYKSA